MLSKVSQDKLISVKIRDIYSYDTLDKFIYAKSHLQEKYRRKGCGIQEPVEAAEVTTREGRIEAQLALTEP